MASRLILTRHFNLAVPKNYRGIALTRSTNKETTDKPVAELVRLDNMTLATEEQHQTLIESAGKVTVKADEDIGLASSIPEEHIKTRHVRIYQPPKNAMQSGSNNIHYWQIDFDTRERWENPLMGWSSTGDPLSNLKVDFATMEEAIEHCEKMRWKYYVQKPNRDAAKPRVYGSNFAWNKRTRVSTK